MKLLAMRMAAAVTAAMLLPAAYAVHATRAAEPDAEEIEQAPAPKGASETRLLEEREGNRLMPPLRHEALADFCELPPLLCGRDASYAGQARIIGIRVNVD